MTRKAASRPQWGEIFLRDGEWQAFARKAGAWFGLAFGIGVILFAWGPHVYYIVRYRMLFPWLQIVSGVVFIAASWSIAGYLAGAAGPVRWSILIGAIAGFLTPWFFWLAELLHENLPWFMDYQGWEPVIHLGASMRTRLLFSGFWGIGIGAAVGLLERIMLPHAWDLSSGRGKTTLRSMQAYAICIPLAIVLGMLTSDVLYGELHHSLAGTSEGLAAFETGESRRPFLTWRFGQKKLESRSQPEWPSGEYVIELVDYNSDSMEQYFFDVLYYDGLSVRCVGGSASISLCGNVTDTLQQMMTSMIDHVVSRRLGDLACKTCDPYVKPSVIAALAGIRGELTPFYAVYKSHQRGGAITMVALFDTGYKLTCHFHGDLPIVVEFCQGE